MTAIIENKYTFPKHPSYVLDAEKKLRAEAPDLYIKVSRFRDSKNLQCYERAKGHLSLSKYPADPWQKTLADFCNV